jgi:hypothetical protein
MPPADAAPIGTAMHECGTTVRLYSRPFHTRYGKSVWVRFDVPDAELGRVNFNDLTSVEWDDDAPEEVQPEAAGLTTQEVAHG